MTKKAQRLIDPPPHLQIHKCIMTTWKKALSMEICTAILRRWRMTKHHKDLVEHHRKLYSFDRELKVSNREAKQPKKKFEANHKIHKMAGTMIICALFSIQCLSKANKDPFRKPQ